MGNDQYIFYLAIIIFVGLILKLRYDERNYIKSPKFNSIKSSRNQNVHQFSQEEVNQIKNNFILERITSIRVFQINEPFYDIQSENQYLIDGGLEIFTNKGVLTIAFSSESEQYIFTSRKFCETYFNENEFELNQDEIPQIFNLIGKQIIDIHFKIKEFNESVDFETSQNVSKIVEILISFEDANQLQLALIDYDLNQNKKPINYRYSIENGILITFNKIEIK